MVFGLTCLCLLWCLSLRSVRETFRVVPHTPWSAGRTSYTYNLGGPPHPVIVTIRDNGDYIRVLIYSCYTTITGWGVLLTYNPYKPHHTNNLLLDSP